VWCPEIKNASALDNGAKALHASRYHPSSFALGQTFIDPLRGLNGSDYCLFTGTAPRRVRRFSPPVRTTHRLSQGPTSVTTPLHSLCWI